MCLDSGRIGGVLVFKPRRPRKFERRPEELSLMFIIIRYHSYLPKMMCCPEGP